MNSGRAARRREADREESGEVRSPPLGAGARIVLVARHELTLNRQEFVPTLLYFVMPLALLAFVQGAFETFLVLEGSDARGSSLAAPGQATMFGFMSLATFGHFFLAEFGWGTWNRIRSVGVRPWQVMAGKAAIQYAKVLVLFGFVLGASTLLFGFSVRGSLPALLLVELASAATIVAYGLVACALAASQAQFNAFAYLGALVLAGVGGALTPFETLPSWAQTIAPALPTYWAVRGFRTVVLDGGGIGDVGLELGVLVAFTAGLLLLGLLLFDPDRRRSTWA